MADVDEILRPLITRIRIESAWGPQPPEGWIINDPFGPSTGKIEKGVAFMKPKVTFDTPGGPIVIAPAGEPGSSRWPLVKGGVLVLTGFGILGIVILATKK